MQSSQILDDFVGEPYYAKTPLKNNGTFVMLEPRNTLDTLQEKVFLLRGLNSHVFSLCIRFESVVRWKLLKHNFGVKLQSCKNVPTVPTSRCYFFLAGANFWANTQRKKYTTMSTSYWVTSTANCTTSHQCVSSTAVVLLTHC